MQKVATRIFITASIVFGVLGILLVLVPQGPKGNESIFFTVIQKLFFISIFVILPSFALAVAGRFLSVKH